MDVFRYAERVMAMDDAAWARHANPWSGATRFTVLPLVALAVWSRVRIGGWALVAVAAALTWAWWSPRAFAPVRDARPWMTRAVLGERVFLSNRDAVPSGHRRAALLLAAASVPGILLMAGGLWALWWEGAVFGVVLAMLPKAWFCDRMVWLHDDRTGAGHAVPGAPPEEVR